MASPISHSIRAVPDDGLCIGASGDKKCRQARIEYEIDPTLTPKPETCKFVLSAMIDAAEFEEGHAPDDYEL